MFVLSPSLDGAIDRKFTIRGYTDRDMRYAPPPLLLGAYLVPTIATTCLLPPEKAGKDPVIW